MHPIRHILMLATLAAILSSCGKETPATPTKPPAKGRLVYIDNVGHIGDLDGDGDADYVSNPYSGNNVIWVAPDMRNVSVQGFDLSAGRDMTPRMQAAATELLRGYTDPDFDNYFDKNLAIFKEEAGQ